MRNVKSSEIVHSTPAKLDEQHARAEQADRRVGRDVAQLFGVLADALVGVHAHLVAARGQPERAARCHPEPQQIARQAFAQAKLERLRDPALRDVEDEQARDDHEIHAELVQELVQVAAREGVVERLVPVVQDDLAVALVTRIATIKPARAR